MENYAIMPSLKEIGFKKKNFGRFFLTAAAKAAA
jgi:hypothetical protein